MRLRPDYVPASIDEAVQEILNALTNEDRDLFFAAAGEISHVHSIGQQILDAWGPWDKDSPLVRDCAARRLSIDPPVSSLFYIMASVWERLWKEVIAKQHIPLSFVRDPPTSIPITVTNRSQTPQ